MTKVASLDGKQKRLINFFVNITNDRTMENMV